MTTRHVPTRPEWTCTGCGRPWPCAGARVHLRTEYADRPIALAVYMSGHLIDAVRDLVDHTADPPGIPPDVFNRFLGWTRGHGEPVGPQS